MKLSATTSALFGSLLVSLPIACSIAATASTTSVLDNLTHGSSHILGLLQDDDPRFTMEITYDETDLPTTPVLMNTVEILAQYAEMDYLGRTRGRHGIVLESYPQVEIAVLPAGPARSIEVRLVIWAIYGGILEIVKKNMFKQSDITFRWDGRAVGNVYITKPLDDLSITSNSMLGNLTNLDANIGRFGWIPVYKPSAQNLPPKDVFIMVMGTIQTIAEHQMDEKIEGAFYMGSAFVNAHVEVYLQDRRLPRRTPSYFQYGHLLEAVRRIPAWMLQNRRFAEMYCSISSTTLPVGQMVMAKGQYYPHLNGITGNISIS